jgi:excisionase family DNA binding protein
MSAAAKRDPIDFGDRQNRSATLAAMRQAAVAVFNKLSFTVEEACEATGLSKTTLYEEASHGHLEMGKLCGRTVIKADELRRWFDTRYETLARRG